MAHPAGVELDGLGPGGGHGLGIHIGIDVRLYDADAELPAQRLQKAGQRGGFPGAGGGHEIDKVHPPLPQLLPEGLRLGIIVGKHALLDFENPYMVHGHPLLLWLNQNPSMAIV